MHTLQEGVGDTIGKLVRGGITVWVITGDKEETAVNIGIACQLIWAPSRMERTIINTRNYPTREAVREKLLHEFQRYSTEMDAAQSAGGSSAVKPRALVIDGPAFLLCEQAVKLKKSRKKNGRSAGGNGSSTSGASPTAAAAAAAAAGVGADSGSSSNGDANGAVSDGEDDTDANTGNGVAAVASSSGAAAATDDDDELLEEGRHKQQQQQQHKHKHKHNKLFSKHATNSSNAAEQLSAKEALLQLATVCQAVVGCRMSPDQKRQLVVLVKKRLAGARTLAVGDGANDVPMIQAAHVGVGISGQEGLQAVNASDYSLAQFRFLQGLLLCHGRYNYWRMSFVTTYLFYKSVGWGMPLFAYAWYNGLSGNFFYDFVASNLWYV
jgi:magnesium-transporting ATPase (P-type)